MEGASTAHAKRLLIAEFAPMPHGCVAVKKPAEDNASFIGVDASRNSAASECSSECTIRIVRSSCASTTAPHDMPPALGSSCVRPCVMSSCIITCVTTTSAPLARSCSNRRLAAGMAAPPAPNAPSSSSVTTPASTSRAGGSVSQMAVPGRTAAGSNVAGVGCKCTSLRRAGRHAGAIRSARTTGASSLRSMRCSALRGGGAAALLTSLPPAAELLRPPAAVPPSPTEATPPSPPAAARPSPPAAALSSRRRHADVPRLPADVSLKNSTLPSTATVDLMSTSSCGIPSTHAMPARR